MSVAFRRESDEEHLEPRFELPIPVGPNLVTQRGRALIVAHNAELEALLVQAEGEEARKPVLRDLRYWRNRLATAHVAPPATGEIVAIGTRVTFQRDGVPRTIDIVGHDESDPAASRLAFSAPMARALIGAGVGDEVDAPGSDATLEVISIEPLPDEG